MNVRFLATACYLACVVLLLEGCASNPPSAKAPAAAEPIQIGNLPQALLPDAKASDVKSIAMGAARSKGWTIGQSAKDKIVLQRPSGSGYALGGNGMPPMPGSMLEVTTYFVEQAGDVTVASKAEVVSKTAGPNGTTRADVTEDYRGSLEQSLGSLQSAWSQQRDRLARAAPPDSGWKDAWSDTHPTAPANSTTAITDSAPGDAPSPKPGTTPAAAPPIAPVAAASTRTASDTPAAPPSLRQPLGTPSHTQSTPRYSQQPSRLAPYSNDSGYTRPAPEPRRSGSGAAPVVDATTALNQGSSSTTVSSARSYGSPSSVPEENMMSLPSTGSQRMGSLGMAAVAEQYARQRGCTVSTEGSQLIESRQDGEVHKVPCTNSDSVLVKCQSGACKGLL